MLLVVSAEAAVIRAPPLDRSVVNQRHFGRFYKNFTAAAVVFHIVCDQDSLAPVLRTALQHEHLAILEHRFAFDLLITDGADGYDYIVEEIRTCLLRHMRSRFDGSSGTRSYYPSEVLYELRVIHFWKCHTIRVVLCFDLSVQSKRRRLSSLPNLLTRERQISRVPAPTVHRSLRRESSSGIKALQSAPQNRLLS